MTRIDLVHLPSGIDVERRGTWLPESCPQSDDHDPLPTDFDEPTGLSKTRRQIKHSVCGLWTQWVPRGRIGR